MGNAARLLANQRRSQVPLLYPGDHLDQRKFMRRYEAYPDPEARFECIGGIVYRMTPAGFDHGSNAATKDGVFRSLLFPGLWVDLRALLQGDTQRLATTLEQGLETPEHATFVEKLGGQRRRIRKGGT